MSKHLDELARAKLKSLREKRSRLRRELDQLDAQIGMLADLMDEAQPISVHNGRRTDEANHPEISPDEPLGTMIPILIEENGGE